MAYSPSSWNSFRLIQPATMQQVVSAPVDPARAILRLTSALTQAAHRGAERQHLASGRPGKHGVLDGLERAELVARRGVERPL